MISGLYDYILSMWRRTLVRRRRNGLVGRYTVFSYGIWQNEGCGRGAHTHLSSISGGILGNFLGIYTYIAVYKWFRVYATIYCPCGREYPRGVEEKRSRGQVWNRIPSINFRATASVLFSHFVWWNNWDSAFFCDGDGEQVRTVLQSEFADFIYTGMTKRMSFRVFSIIWT